MHVKFYESADDKLLKFAVIIAQYNGRFVFCKHKDRDTYEIPGGHREEDEDILKAAERELYEETGAIEFSITPVFVYSVTGKNRVNETGNESFGMLYYADIKKFDELKNSEMECICFFDDIPDKLTYPDIQPKFIQEWKSRLL